jgi:hypothetical protein
MAVVRSEPRESGKHMDPQRLLRIYLNDHLAGEIAAREVARRSLRSNRGTALGTFLEKFLGELEQDAEALREVMRRLEVGPDPAKAAAVWLAEKVGRLKLNGNLLAYSDLSRLEELEFLSLGVEGKLALWRVLQELVATDRRLAGMAIGRLIQRAERQRNELERHRLEAATRTFAAPARTGRTP